MPYEDIKSFIERLKNELDELAIADEVNVTATEDKEDSAWCGEFNSNSHHIKDNICPHCGGDIRIRNPKGYCDHLYYPESCETCQDLLKQFFKDEDFDL